MTRRKWCSVFVKVYRDVFRYRLHPLLKCTHIISKDTMRLLLYTIAYFFAALSAALAQTIGSMGGRVLESNTREPFEGAKIEVTGPNGIRTTYSNANGEFSLKGIPTGLYSVRCELTGYFGDVYVRFAEVTVGSPSADSLLFVIRYEVRNQLGDNLVVHWPLDGHANDSYENKLHGSVSGAKPTTNRFGETSGAMAFDGNATITMPNHPSLSSLPITVAFWMRVDTMQGDPIMFLGKYVRPSGEGYAMFFEKNMLCAGYFRNGFSTWTRANAEFSDDKEWHFYAITIDSTAIVVYRDNARMITRPFQNQPSGTTSTEPFRIGKISSTMTNSATHGLIGAIDDLEIYDRALNDAEVRLVKNK